jgi:hypothetical protein
MKFLENIYLCGVALLAAFFCLCFYLLGVTAAGFLAVACFLLAMVSKFSRDERKADEAKMYSEAYCDDIKLHEYMITVDQVSARLSDPDDRRENPKGVYYYSAISEQLALDMFHLDIPIGNLEDFKITVEKRTRMV